MADDIGAIYSKLNKIDERVTALEATRPYLEKLIERNINSNEKLGDALNEMQVFMQRMNDKIDTQSSSINGIKDDLEIVNKKIEQVEQRSKFDILEYIKKNWPAVMLAVVGASAYFASLGIL